MARKSLTQNERKARALSRSAEQAERDAEVAEQVATLAKNLSDNLPEWMPKRIKTFHDRTIVQAASLAERGPQIAEVLREEAEQYASITGYDLSTA